MELRSARRLRRSPPPPPNRATSRRLPRSSDRISALSDDMILLILSRLGSVRAAARTDVLSRRWRGLWTRLTDLAFCNDVPHTTEVALARFSASPVVSSVHIRFQLTHDPRCDPSSLLRAAALLSPAELVFVLKKEWSHTVYRGYLACIVLPCYHCLTSIELDVGLLSISLPPAGEFPLLEKLFLAGYILYLGTLLSRCPRLRVLAVTFRGVDDPDSLHTGLAKLESAAAALGHTLSLIGIETRSIQAVDAARFGPLLRSMARLSPQKVIFNHDFGRSVEADLPCFHHATSIVMKLSSVCFTTLLDGEFSALDTLSLSANCSILVDLGTLVSRCPRLRVLEVAVAMGDITVYSASLQNLSIYSKTECHRIDIVAPVLKQLELSVQGCSGRDLSVSISAPMAEKFSWKRWYTTSVRIFGFWRLECARLESKQEEATCSELPRRHALCLHISCTGRRGSRPNFEKEMENILITNFSMLDLSLRVDGHVFGALVSGILAMHRIRAATEKLTIAVFRGDKKRHPRSCPCDKPKNWRSQSISLPNLEEFELDGFNWEDDEHDFLRLVSTCSPKLKRVVVRLAYTFEGCTAEIEQIYNSCLANPSVNCYVYSFYGDLLVQQASG